MIGNNAGLPGTVPKIGEFLDLLRARTSPGALLIAQSMDPGQTDDERHLAYHRRNEAAGATKGEVRIRIEYFLLARRSLD